MAIQTTPHTESQQNSSPAASDLEPGQTVQTIGTGEDASLYANAEGAETGTNRNPRVADGAGGHGSLPPSNTLEGSLKTRTPGGGGQGISSHAAGEESAGQEKVVSERPDAQSAVNETGTR